MFTTVQNFCLLYDTIEYN